MQLITEDAMCVSETLYRYGRDEAKFSCSKTSDVARQRERMMAACADFAKDYQLRFTP